MSEEERKAGVSAFPEDKGFCIALGCTNERGQGTFREGYCLPCWSFIQSNYLNPTEADWGKEGIYGLSADNDSISLPGQQEEAA